MEDLFLYNSREMFKPGSGRKVECEVWKYFHYDKASDRSQCEIEIRIGDKDNSEACGQRLTGKNATNLRNHIKSKHKEIHAALLSSEKQQRPEKVQKQNINSTDTTETMQVCTINFLLVSAVTVSVTLLAVCTVLIPDSIFSSYTTKSATVVLYRFTFANTLILVKFCFIVSLYWLVWLYYIIGLFRYNLMEPIPIVNITVHVCFHTDKFIKQFHFQSWT
jgi:hypothetical protein